MHQIFTDTAQADARQYATRLVHTINKAASLDDALEVVRKYGGKREAFQVVVIWLSRMGKTGALENLLEEMSNVAMNVFIQEWEQETPNS